MSACVASFFSFFLTMFSKGFFLVGVKVVSTPTHAFLGFFLSVLRTIPSPIHCLRSKILIVETIDNGEREKIPVAMTIINPRKFCRNNYPIFRKNIGRVSGSSQRPPVLKSCSLPTEVCRLSDSNFDHTFHCFISDFLFFLTHYQTTKF